MRIVFDHSESEAANIRTFYFRTEEPFGYKAGQYVELTLKHDDVDEYGDTRPFTLSSSPADGMVSITSKFTDKDGSSFKRALRRLKPGGSLSMSQAMGSFTLPEDTRTPLVMVAGGIGITPFKSMLSWMVTAGEKRPIKLLYALNSEEEIVFQSTFKTAGLEEVTIVVSNPSPGWEGKRGYLSPELILGLEKPSKDTLIYLSGPDPMVESLQDGLLKSGIKQRQMVLDAFLGYSRV